MVVLWLLLTFSKIVIINRANMDKSMMDEELLQSRYQAKSEWFKRLNVVMLQATSCSCFEISSVNVLHFLYNFLK